MNATLKRLPCALIFLMVAGLLWYGRIEQLPHYHDFADGRAWLGIPNAQNVLSNIPFACVGLWGFAALWPSRKRVVLTPSWPAYAIFLVAIFFVAFGSGYYHWAPDDPRLVWDRLPIALACGALLAAVHADCEPGAPVLRELSLWSLFAIGGVFWWQLTNAGGHGDLRPYLVLQVLTLVLIPLWQWSSPRPAAERRAFVIAIGLFVLARIAELTDHPIYRLTGELVSGHTLKHLLMAAAAFVVAVHLVQRARAGDTA